MTPRYVVGGFAGVVLVLALVAVWDCGWWSGRLERERVLCTGVTP